MLGTKQAMVGATPLIVRCDESLARQADWLFGLLQKLSIQGVPIEAGRRIEFGWSMLSFRSDQKGGLVVCEPDFSSNPFMQVRDDISCTLEIQERQNALAKRLDITLVPASFQDKVVIDKGCLSASRIYMERNFDAPKGDSGWYIGFYDAASKEPELEALYVYELVRQRPELMECLGLPPGFMAVFNDRRLEAVMDSSNKVVLSS